MIEINNFTAELLDKRFFRQCVEAVLNAEKKKDIDLSIAFVSENEIKRVNKKYRNKNKITDVLSFGEFEFKDVFEGAKQDLKKFLQEENTSNFFLEKKFLEFAEIIICVQEVKKNSAKFDLVFEKELARVFVHGILHILGYDHEKNAKQAEIMKEKENYYLSLCVAKKAKDKN